MFGVMIAAFGSGESGLPVTEGLQNWLDASTIAGVTFDGASGPGETIDTAIDISTITNDWQVVWTGATETRPTWEDPIQNGLGAILFPTPNAVRLETPAIFSGTQEGEIWAVLKKWNGPTNNSGLWQMGQIEPSSVTYHTLAGSKRFFNGWGSTTAKTLIVENPAGIVSDGNWHLVNVTSTASSWNMYVNDVLQHNTASNTVGWMTASWVWGESSSGVAGAIYLGESVIFNRILSAGERASMRSYFNSKWNLY